MDVVTAMVRSSVAEEGLSGKKISKLVLLNEAINRAIACGREDPCEVDGVWEPTRDIDMLKGSPVFLMLPWRRCKMASTPKTCVLCDRLSRIGFNIA